MTIIQRGRESIRNMDRVQRIFVMCWLARLILDLLFMLNVLPLDLRYGWYLHHGGDQDEMMALAHAIRRGVPERSVVAIGQPLMMIPWIEILDEYFYLGIAVPMLILNGFILGGLSVLLVGSLARRLTGQDTAAVLAAGVWAMLPLLGYLAFFWHPEWQTLRSAMVPKLGWLNGLSDGPATFYILTAMWALSKQIQQNREVGFWVLFGVGVALGLAIEFRAVVGLAAAGLLFYVLLAYRLPGLLVSLGALLLTYLPQAWYNLTVFGLPFTTGYFVYGDISAYGGTFRRPLPDLLKTTVFHPRHIWENITHLVIGRVWLVFLLMALLVVGVFVMVFFWRHYGWRIFLLLVGVPLVYIVPMASAWNFRDDVVRLLLPVMPMLLIVGVIAGVESWLAASRFVRKIPTGGRMTG
nr:hypothetical protein [Anaerolineae bacterium]